MKRKKDYFKYIPIHRYLSVHSNGIFFYIKHVDKNGIYHRKKYRIFLAASYNDEQNSKCSCGKKIPSNIYKLHKLYNFMKKL